MANTAPIVNDQIREMDKKFLDIWDKNLTCNLDNNFFGPWFKYTNYVNVWGPKMRDKPWVLIAAGPSLDKNISMLKEVRDDVYVLCVDVIIFKLILEKMHPDLVVNIDPADVTRFWEGWNGKNEPDACLVAPVTTHPNNLMAWKGKRYLFNPVDYYYKDKYLALKAMTKECKEFGNIVNAGFVGATMLQIVKDVRPTKGVFLLGWDFAFTDNKVYCQGFLDRRYPIDDGSLHNAEFDKKDSCINGIWTTQALMIYMRTSMDILKRWNIHVTNCTEGGLLNETEWIKTEKFKDAITKALTK